MDGLIDVKLTVAIANEGESRGVDVSPVRLSVDGGEPELVTLVTAIEPGESYSFTFRRLINHGRRLLAFSVGDGDEFRFEEHYQVSDPSLEVGNHRIAGDGVTFADVEIANNGELPAEQITLHVAWRLTGDDSADAWESDDYLLDAAPLGPGETRSEEIFLEIGRGEHEVVYEVTTSSIEVDLTNNRDESEILVEYVFLEITDVSTEFVGYEPDGRAKYEVTMEVLNNGLSRSGKFNVGIECVATKADLCDVRGSGSVESIDPGSSATGGFLWIVPVDGVKARAFAGSYDDGLLWGEQNVEDFNIGAPGQPENLLLLETSSEVIGYWSDGTARVDMSLMLRNEGYEPADGPQGMVVSCTANGDPVAECGGDLVVSLTEGFGPTESSIELKPPQGDVELTIEYGGSEPLTLALEVPRRIVGVDREVWECFSDIPDEEDDRVGCADWDSEIVRKWDQSDPLKLWSEGDDHYLEILDELLAELVPLLNLNIERVENEVDADLTVHTGIRKTDTTKEEFGEVCANAAGCATRWVRDGSVVYRGRIVVWTVGEHWETFQLTDRLIRDVTLHELVHALSTIGHRSDFASIVSDGDSLFWADLSLVDEALLRIHSHELVEPGMTIPEVEPLLIFTDELLAPPEPEVPDALDIVGRAYVALREAGSVRFSVRGSWPVPQCGYEFGWAEYEIDDLRRDRPRVIRFEDGQDHIVYLESSADSVEYWVTIDGRWETTDAQDALEPTGWRDSFGNLLMVLGSVVYYADPDAIEVEQLPSRLLKLSVQLDKALKRSDEWRQQTIDVVLLMDDETYEIEEYSVDWDISGSVTRCDKYQLEAKDGEYGIEIEFPDEIVAESVYFK